MPSALCSDGWRMSASISSTGRPVCALLIASASAVVVLPSPFDVLVTMNALGAPSRVENCSAVRTERYASANGRAHVVVRLQRQRPCLRPTCARCIRGTTPSTGSCVSFSMSSGVRMRVVEVLEEERERDAADQPQQHRDHQVLAQVGLERRAAAPRPGRRPRCCSRRSRRSRRPRSAAAAGRCRSSGRCRRRASGCCSGCCAPAGRARPSWSARAWR